MSKQFTAAAVVKLQMQGRLRVSDPIDRFFDGVPEDKRGVTVRHLLTHTAGLVEALGDDDEPLTRRAMIVGALTSELRAPPGTRYHYSNVGYSLLAAIIEKASGRGTRTTWRGTLRTRRDDAHGLRAAGLGHRRRGGRVRRPGPLTGSPVRPSVGCGRAVLEPPRNGGLLSTAHDMGRWLLSLESNRVLDERAKEALRPRVLEQPGGDSRYAYGWVVADTPLGTVNWHNGGNGWTYAELGRLPESGAGLFWVTNHYRSAAGGWNFESFARRSPSEWPRGWSTRGDPDGSAPGQSFSSFANGLVMRTVRSRKLTVTACASTETTLPRP